MITQNPRISIGLPVYNGEKFLKESLDSLLAQTFTDFEIIICDNASTDETEKICRGYAAKDKRIRYYRNEHNLGAAPNYNRTFELAKGEYFKWAADDDICAPTLLERCIEVLDNNPTVVLTYPKTVFTKPDGQRWWEGKSNPEFDTEEPHQRFQAVISPANFMCCEVFGLIRSDVLKKTSLIASYYGSDKLLLAELSLMGRLREIPEPLFFRRCHSKQSSRLSAKERDAWIDAGVSKRLKVFRKRGSIEFFKAIFRTPLSLYERSLCLMILLRSYILSIRVWERFFKKMKPRQV